MARTPDLPVCPSSARPSGAGSLPLDPAGTGDASGAPAGARAGWGILGGLSLRRLLLLPALGLVALALAAPVSAHRDPELGLVHEIDHMISDTNALRKDLGKRPFAVDRSYRELEDLGALDEVILLWSGRFETALKQSYWWDLCLCESGGNWSMKGRYHGGFSFHPRTWAAYRSKGLPKYAYLATPGEQIRVARKVRAAQGWEAWPECSRRIGLL